MAKKQKKSKKNDGKKAAEAKNLAEAASKSAVVDDMEPLEATAAMMRRRWRLRRQLRLRPHR